MIEGAARTTKYKFSRDLVPGDFVEIYGTYVAGTSDFSVNIRDNNDDYMLHLAFRPTYKVELTSFRWGGWSTSAIIACKFHSCAKFVFLCMIENNDGCQ